jgi:hypothetical protein
VIRRPGPLVAAVIISTVGAGWFAGSRIPVLDAAPGSAGALMAAAPSWAVVRLLAGTYEPFEVTRRVTIEGTPGAVVRGPLVISADGVNISDLLVVGGENGIVIRDADRVQLERVVVRDARLHGIEVAPGSATIRDCRIEGLLSPYAQGFEIRNSSGRPHTVVEGCSISSGQEGLVSHVSRVEFRGNHVSDTSLRAIVITEMSEGLAEGNDVSGVSGIGLYCGDESHCEFRGNIVRGVLPVDPAVSEAKSYGGYGAVALYRATMRLEGNRFEDAAAGRVGLFLGSVETDRSPLTIWPPGWRGALPGVWISAAALLGMLAAAAAARPLVHRRRRSGAGIPSRAVTILIFGLGVQSFHMLEHVAQVVQRNVLESEHHTGLLGSAFDSEWVHFVYNLAVLVFLVWALRVVWGSAPSSTAQGALAFLVADVGLQTYHMVEHSVRIVQHITQGVTPAPGILGQLVDLIWLHYGLNLAVYSGFVAALVLLLWSRAPVLVEPSPDPSVPAAVAQLDTA